MTLQAVQSSSNGSFISKIQEVFSTLYEIVKRVISAVWNFFTCASFAPPAPTTLAPVTVLPVPVVTPAASSVVITAPLEVRGAATVLGVSSGSEISSTSSSDSSPARGRSSGTDDEAVREFSDLGVSGAWLASSVVAVTSPSEPPRASSPDTKTYAAVAAAQPQPHPVATTVAIPAPPRGRGELERAIEITPQHVDPSPTEEWKVVHGRHHKQPSPTDNSASAASATAEEEWHTVTHKHHHKKEEGKDS